MMAEPKTTSDWVRALMQDGKPRTAAQISEVIDAPRSTVRTVLSAWVETGEAHICMCVGPSRTPVFRMGPGDGTPPPQLQAHDACESAMTVLATAIDTMVRRGAQ